MQLTRESELADRATEDAADESFVYADAGEASVCAAKLDDILF